MSVSIAPVRKETSALRIAFEGAPPNAAPAALHLDVRWLAGAAAEELFDAAVPAGAIEGGRLYRSHGLLVGHISEPFHAADLATDTEAIYRRMLQACHGHHLYRIWNYVPAINAETNGLEHYRAFCQGRARAFEADLGGQFEPRLPAASAVGSSGEKIEVIFVAGSETPAHVENPEQIPAYRYPTEHGPRAPSFARATVARDDARTFTFISGTAAIKGHRTIAPDDLAGQLDCTVDNLRLISSAAGLGEALGAGRGAARHFKIYLRHADDLAMAHAHLAQSLLGATDTVTYLHAAVCRAALHVEIEATIIA